MKIDGAFDLDLALTISTMSKDEELLHKYS
jgi:hypothetical protein